MFCSYCGSEVDTDSRFCGECGKELPVTSGSLAVVPCDAQQIEPVKPKQKVKIREFSCSSDRLGILITSLEEWLRNQKFIVQTLQIKDGHTLLQIKKSGFFKKSLGMTSTLNILLKQESRHRLIVEIGSGQWADKWADKAVAGAVGMFLFAPVAVTAGVGAWQQMKLPGKVFDFIDALCQKSG